jgi:Lon protease-like protein
VDDVREPEPGPAAGALLATAERLLRRTLALRAELGDPAAPATVELAGDVTTAAFQVAALAPIGPADAQRVLETASTDGRLDLVARLLEEEAEVLEARAAGG